MNTEQNKSIVRRYLQEVWEKGNLAVANELLAENYLCYEPGATEPFGRDATVRDLKAYHVAFPDLRLNNPEFSAEGDTVSVRATMQGTHQGEFGGIAASGHRISLPFSVRFRVADGKIVEERDDYDQQEFMRQLGAPQAV